MIWEVKRMRQHFKRSNLIIFLTIFLLFFIFLLVHSFERAQQQKEEYLASEMRAFEEKIDVVFTTYEQIANGFYQQTINQPEVLQLIGEINEANRNGEEKQLNLSQAIERPFSNLQAMHFDHLRLFNRRGETIFSLHNQSVYEDIPYDKSLASQLVETQTFASYFEQDDISVSQRYLYPLFSDGDFVGSFELSLSVVSLATVFYELYPSMYTGVMLNAQIEDEMDEEVLRQFYIGHDVFDTFYLHKDIARFISQHPSLDNQIRQSLLHVVGKDQKEALAENLSFSQHISHDTGEYLIHFHALVDMENNRIGYVSGISEDLVGSYFENYLRNDVLLLTLIFILITIIMFTGYIKNKQLSATLSRDQLTKLFNRHKLVQLAEQMLTKKQPLAVLLIDVDHFKQINDRNGHNVGDAVLSQFGTILAAHASDKLVPGRWGGEEFMVLLKETNPDRVQSFAEELKDQIKTTIFTKDISLTVSIGFTVSSADFVFEEVVGEADQALYVAKANGRDQVVSFNDLSGKRK